MTANGTASPIPMCTQSRSMVRFPCLWATPAAEYADEWCPIDAGMLNTTGKPDVAGAIALFRQLATEANRDPDDIPITIHSFKVNPERFEQYAELGVERIVLFPPSMGVTSTDSTLAHLDMLATEVIEKMG